MASSVQERTLLIDSLQAPLVSPSLPQACKRSGRSCLTAHPSPRGPGPCLACRPHSNSCHRADSWEGKQSHQTLWDCQQQKMKTAMMFREIWINSVKFTVNMNILGSVESFEVEGAQLSAGHSRWTTLYGLYFCHKVWHLHQNCIKNKLPSISRSVICQCVHCILACKAVVEGWSQKRSLTSRIHPPQSILDMLSSCREGTRCILSKASSPIQV